MPENFINIDELCKRLNCATSTIYRWIEQGHFPRPIKIGGMARWSEGDYDGFVQEAVQRRNDAGLRPRSVRRGRPTHSRNPHKKK
ncbi:helix-turn-helix transcriptional regulator [Roseovarius aquimarinus]